MVYSRITRIFSIVGFLAILTLGGCTVEQDFYENPRFSDPSEYIVFAAQDSPISASVTTKSTSGHLIREVEEWPVTAAPATKAAPTSSLTGMTAGLIGFNYSGDWSDAKEPWDAIDNEAYNFVSANNTLTTADPVKWVDIPVAGNLRIYAYAPKSFVGANATLTHASGVPTITYTVPNDGGTTDYTEQADLLSAVNTVASDYKEGVPLNFQHALAGIQFKLGFAATVKSISIKGVYKKGTYKLGDFSTSAWTPVVTGTPADDVDDYTISFNGGAGTAFAADAMISGTGRTLGAGSTLLLIPQTVPAGATVELVYNDGSDHTISASIADHIWQPNKLVTYTIYKENAPSYIYFDLAAGDVTIHYNSAKSTSNYWYSGYVYKNNGTEVTLVEGAHLASNRYYVYQSTEANKAGTGWSGEPEAVGSEFRNPPTYSEVRSPDGSKSWSEFITNNPDCDAVINAWPTAAAAVSRTSTSHKIWINQMNSTLKDVEVNITIDNVWSSFYTAWNPSTRLPIARSDGGFMISPGVTGTGPGATSGHGYRDKTNNRYDHVTLCLKGDNHFHNVMYYGHPTTQTDSHAAWFKITSAEGDGSASGSLTVTPDLTTRSQGEGNGVLGSNDNDYGPPALDMYFNGGTIYAGTSSTQGDEPSGVLGGGCNQPCRLFFNGATVTSVAYSSAAAIGGGGGRVSFGGDGDITVNSGKVYAYQFGVIASNSVITNYGGGRVQLGTHLSSVAIGGGSSFTDIGNGAEVKIYGGDVYAQSVGGAAIGGGTSCYTRGGNASVLISGGYVDAKSVLDISNGIDAGSSIGGGQGGVGSTDNPEENTSANANGGSATITISGGVLKTGSIGGGSTLSVARNSTIGSAIINVNGGEIQGQFIMAAGAATAPSFTMTDGTINNSGLLPALGYNKVQDYGGAVYIGAGTNPGSFTMTGGTIVNSSADLGGAVYMGAGEFEMSGGTIENCSAPSGGAVYIANEGTPTFTMSGSAEIKRSSATTGNGGALYMAAGTVTMQSSANINNCTSYLDGGAIYVASGTMNMEGGTIQRNSTTTANGGAISLTGGTVDMTGGTISGNKAELKGGGVYVNNGSFGMSAGSITGNASKGEGGGVAVSSGATLVIGITGGSITGNTTQEKGGGISIQPTGSNSVELNIGTDGSPSIVTPDISANGATKGGGGIYVSGSTSTINLYSGKVKGNSVSTSVGNEDVENTNGVVNLGNTDVVDVMVIYHRNDGSTPDKTQNQRVLKDAYSTLNCPSSMFTHPGGKVFSGWTANADGSGDTYTNGQLVRITSTLHIYAQWTNP